MEQRKVKKWHQKLGLAAAVGFASVPAFAIDMIKGPDMTADIVADINGAKAPIAAVAGASMGAYVAIRVWKLVRRAI